MSAPRPEVPAPSRRRLLLLTVPAAVIGLAVLAAALVGGTADGQEPSAAGARASAASGTSGSARTADPSPGGPAASAAPTEQAPAAAVATGPTEGADRLPPALPAVGLRDPASTEGISATLRSVEAIDGTGVGPGNIAGPALRVTVRLDNGSPEPVPLDGVMVSLTHGPDQTPASPLDDPSRAHFSGSVAPGGSADGIYVFTVPADERDTVTVQVGYRAGAPLLVFTGRP